ncbi:MAG: lipase family protein [Cytophagaceae bacterium]
MKKTVVIIFLSLSIQTFAQLKSGFIKEEARDMIALCNSFTFLDLYKSDSEIIPKNYKKIYTSGVFGMDNKYQIYLNGNTAIINVRGSTAKKISWLENINSAMIPAKGTIITKEDTFNYCFANHPKAAVHTGFALGVAFLRADLLHQIKNLNKDGIYNFILTGHSQGGALCNLLRSYFEHLPAGVISEKNNFKTYTFAAPMVGNKEFNEEYSKLYCENLSSFNVVNPSDPIPTMPLSYNNTNYVGENLKNLIFERESFSLKKTVSDGLVLLFEENVSKVVKKFGESTTQQIKKEVGDVTIPEYAEDINYHKVCNVIEIFPAFYPRILKDSTILQNDSLMTVYKRGSDGYFVNKELYKKEPWGYQHKPYNYYVSILLQYFPEDYKKLRRTYLEENL